MILLFTSESCAWCDILKTMIRTESQDLLRGNFLYEVDIDRHKYITEAYQVQAVPTLVAGATSLTGLPSAEELRSFLLQSATTSLAINDNNRPSCVIRPLSEVSEYLSSTEEIML